MATTSSPNEQGLYLDERHLAIVRSILGRLLPDVAVWAFGSRATGRNLWRCSDLDLAIVSELSWTTRGLLSEAFEESTLPMKVDVLELPMADQEFVERIQPDFVQIQVGSRAALTAA
jgi:predicted nucleotidyltransferase